MESFINKLNIYMIPPVLSLLVGLFLATLFLVKGNLKKSNVLFALVCIWWSLLAPIFISHHLLRGDIELIMKIERSFHFFYVYLPYINILHFHKFFDIKRRWMLIASFILSTLIALTTPTDYYISGLYTYGWGYMAKGGPAFQLFGLYCFAVVIYFIVIFFRMLKRETNYIRRLRLKYIVISFNAVAILTMANIPSMNGVDFYPLGNFMFIPLLVLSYGIIRYRFMDIQTIIHITFIWAVVSSLIIIPNIVIFVVLSPYVLGLSPSSQFPLLAIWFIANYFYFIMVQPRIDQFFNKRKYNLRNAAAQFIENISLLRTLDALIKESIELLKKTLMLRWADIYIKGRDLKEFVNRDGFRIKYDEDIEDWFLGATHLTEKSMVETDPYYSVGKETLLKLFDDLTCSYIMPITHNNELIAFLAMPEKQNLKALSNMEMKFISNIISTMSISLANSMMYQELSTLKDNLEGMVEDRTAELHATMEELESINDTLTRTNRELETAQRTAKRDMEMARYV